jgi:hypothetical protein
MVEDSLIKNRYSGIKHKNVTVVEKVRIKHKDKFNMKYLYMMCHEWFIEHGWGSSSDSDWPEKLYLHRFNQKGGEEVWIWWRFYKDINNLIRFDFDVDWHIVGMENAEIIKNGKKFKGNTGDCEVNIYTKILFDPYNKIGEGPFKNFKELLYERIYYKTFLRHKKELYEETFKFKQVLKTYFNLPTYMPDIEGHHFWQDDNSESKFYEKQ